jgi:carboxyl-terminal processing protease
LRGEESFSLDLTLRKIESYSVSWRMLSEDESIGYIKIEEFNAKTAAQFKHAYDSALAAGAEKLIFDLRDNPGGEINSIADVLDYLLADGGPIAHCRYRENSPLASESESFYADDGHAADLPMAVLCNKNTASAGELFTAALRDYNVATIVGEVTYGKGTMQNIFALPDGTAFTVSVARYDPPYGENYEGVGVIPHISVSLPEDAIKTGSFLLNEAEDTQLQAAIGALNAPLV